MNKNITNIFWLLLQVFFIALIFFLLKIEFLVCTDKSFAGFLSFLCIGSAVGMISFLSVYIIKRKQIPNFDFPLQFISSSFMIFTLFVCYRIILIESHRLVNHPLIHFNIESNLLKAYSSHKHAVFGWNEIKSSYFKENYKKFASYHRDYNNPNRLLHTAIALNFNGHNNNEINYLRALYTKVTVKDVQSFILDNPYKDGLTLLNFLKIVKPEVIPNDK